jgi:hypothetical protein
VANQLVKQGGDPGFQKLWPELQSTQYAEATADQTVRAGEDQPNDRQLVSEKAVDQDSILETLQNAVTAAGVGTAINTKNFKSLTFRVNGTSGTWNGGFQATIDDTNWYYIAVRSVADDTMLAGSTTQFNPSSAAVDQLYVPVSANPAWSQVRFNLVARTSGTVSVTSRKAPR